MRSAVSPSRDGAAQLALAAGRDVLAAGLELGAGLVAGLDRLREPDLVVLGQQRVLTDVGEVEADEVFLVALDALLGHRSHLLVRRLGARGEDHPGPAAKARPGRGVRIYDTDLVKGANPCAVFVRHLPPMSWSAGPPGLSPTAGRTLVTAMADVDCRRGRSHDGDHALRRADPVRLQSVLAHYVVLSRGQPGCRNIDLALSSTVPDRFVIVQKWETPAAPAGPLRLRPTWWRWPRACDGAPRGPARDRPPRPDQRARSRMTNAVATGRARRDAVGHRRVRSNATSSGARLGLPFRRSSASTASWRRPSPATCAGTACSTSSRSRTRSSRRCTATCTASPVIPPPSGPGCSPSRTTAWSTTGGRAVGARRSPTWRSTRRPWSATWRRRRSTSSATGASASCSTASRADQREVLLLRIVADLSLEDVAVALGKRRGAIKSLQHRALATLRRQLDRERAGS